ncbi:MAG: hypothetical protein K5695_00820 [Oscillospiraceae bacterium]|nr:hypothetical protein [Oscillospiraceae bacterium]
MRFKYNWNDTHDDYKYPDILDIIEQEEKAKRARKKRTSRRKPRMDRADIRVRMGLGAYVSKEEAEYYRRTCTPFELAELERFYALHSGMGGLGLAGLYTSSDRGLNHGYSEGYTSTLLEMNGKSALVMMPTATPDINIDDDSANRVHTVLDVLQNNLHEDFGEALQYLTCTCPADIIEALGVTDALSVDFEECYVKRVESSWEQRLDEFKVDVIVHADFMLKVPAEQSCGDHTLLMYRDSHRSIDYRFRYTFDLYGVNGQRTCSGPIAAPVLFFPADSITVQKSWPTNKILRPAMTKRDFPVLAAKMLQDIYPEALKAPTKLDGELLVKRLSRWLKKRYSRMKLRLRKEHLGKGNGIKGRIFFTDMEVPDSTGEMIRFKAGDIVINLDEMMRTSDVLITIVHECVHVYVDLPFFMLQLMAGVPNYSFVDRSSSWLKSEKKRQGFDYQMELIEEMEKQDEKLTAYVLMEEGTFRSECDRLFAITGNDRSPAALMWMLENLTKTYGASMQMTKIHMKEVGIPEVEGIWNFIGNKERVPDHAVSGVWNGNVIYTIDRPDAVALLGSSERFTKALLSGKYIYLEGHYVLSRPKYVEAAPNGWKLTAYAHAHIDECCLSFRPGRRKTTFEYSSGTAARTKKNGNDKYKTVELVSEPGDTSYETENRDFSDNAQLWGELAGSLHGTFNDALQMVLDEIGVSQTTLASRLGVSRQAFQKWLKRDMMLKRHVVGICIALKLDIGVSLKLIELAVLRLGCYGADPVYLHLLCDCNMTVERGNDILVAQHFKKLNDGRQFEFDLVDFDPMTQEELRRKYGVADGQ